MRIFAFILFLNLTSLYSQPTLDIRTLSKFQSEYEWLDSSKIKFTFYTYRYNSITANKRNFPDTAYCSVFFNDILRIKQIPIYKDSVFIPDYFYCLGLSLCNSSSICGNSSFEYTIIRYTGFIDFSSPSIKDTLDVLSACQIEIGFRGQFAENLHFNFENLATSTTTYEHYCFFSINRCFNWKKGDKSSKFREFQPINSPFRLKRQGIVQIDFGSISNTGDSITYELTQPIIYSTKKYRPFTAGFSLNYYINSYCRFGAPCAPRPETNPPQGFYLNPKTGISLHYNVNSSFTYHDLFCVKTKTFKNNRLNQKVLASEQVRIVDFLSSRNNQPAVNQRVLIQNFPLRKYACANKRDTVTIRLRDTMAVNQTIADTIAYQVYQNLPGGSFFESQPGTNNIELKIAWNPTLGKAINNPYLFNINANEQRCWPNREYEFRSCEFYVVQMPKFTISKTVQNCGILALKAESTESDDNRYNFDWTLTHTSGTKLTTSSSTPSLNLPKGGKWYISLKTTNIIHGCTGLFLDSIILPIATPKITILPNADVCQGQSLTYTAQLEETQSPMQYQWQSPLKNSADSFFTQTINDSFKLLLTITDGRGCIAKDSIHQRIFPAYKLLPIKDSAICFQSVINISAQPQSPSDSIKWQHNGSQQISQSIKAGKYEISYKNANGCQATDTFIIIENSDFIPVKYSDQTVCLGDTIDFQLFQSSFVNYDSTTWLINNNKTIRENYIFEKINQATNIVLSTYGKQNNISCQAKDTINVALFLPNTNRLQILKTDTCLNTNEIQVNITGNTNTTRQQILWGDGQTSDFPINIHRYLQANSYKIDLISTTNNNCIDTQSQSIVIYENPQFILNMQDSVICENQLASINLSNQGPSLTYNINWGDGALQTNLQQGNHSHQYGQNGKFVVAAEGSNKRCKTTQKRNIRIHPIPDVQIMAQGFCQNEPTIISATNNAVYQYFWNNNTQSNQAPSYQTVYNQTGNYRITLLTKDNNNCQANDSFNLQIVAKPKAAFSFANQSQIQQFQFQFINESMDANGYKWHFIHQTQKDSSTEKSPKIVFADTGFYQTILIANNNNLCYDTALQIVPIFDKIEFYFPTVFSPNGNGTNDAFGLNARQIAFVKEYKLEIFNRWGERLFSSTDPRKEWQATNVPIGVYVYQSTIRDVFNILHELKGVVEVLR